MEVAVVPEIRGGRAAVVEAAKVVPARVPAAEAAAVEVVVRAAVAAQVAVAVRAAAAAPLVAVAILRLRIHRSRARSRATLSTSAHAYLATRRFSYSCLSSNSFPQGPSSTQFPVENPRSDPQRLSSIDNPAI